MATALSQADYDKAANALRKAGFAPEIIFDVVGGTVTVRPAKKDASEVSDWKRKAPDRV